MNCMHTALITTAFSLCLGWPSGAAVPAVPFDEPAASPWIIAQSFDQPSAAQDFLVLGSGTWQVGSGVYALTQPAQLADSAPGNANLTVAQTPLTVAEWILTTRVQPMTSGTHHDFSVVFNFIDEANYSYANFSDQQGANLNGLFTVDNGVQTKLASFAPAINPGQACTVELRKKDSQVKAYLNSTYVAKATIKTFSSMRVGYGSRCGSVQFDDLIVEGDGAILDPDPTPCPDPPTPTPTPTPTPVGSRLVPVATTAQLQAAVLNARPGDIINLSDGTYGGTKGMPSPIPIGGKTYTGTITATKAGTADLRIVLQGSRKAIINGGSTGGRYGLYLVHANYWTIKGISVTNVTKGIVLDGCNHVRIDGVEVLNTGQEGIHLRTLSSDNVVANSLVHDTGKTNATYGEGIYVGSANSNWGTYTNGQPDRCDRNQLIGNTIRSTGAENMDIKEGTTGGLIRGNTFNGAGMTGSWADSWVDLKGNDWTVTENHGVNAKKDGFQVHGNQLKAFGNWGNNNTFTKNQADVKGPGYGFWLQNNVTGNTIACSNTVTGAAAGFANVPCTGQYFVADLQHGDLETVSPRP